MEAVRPAMRGKSFSAPAPLRLAKLPRREAQGTRLGGSVAQRSAARPGPDKAAQTARPPFAAPSAQITTQQVTSHVMQLGPLLVRPPPVSTRLSCCLIEVWKLETVAERRVSINQACASRGSNESVALSGAEDNVVRLQHRPGARQGNKGVRQRISS